jgi:hypothetical protein
VCLDALDVAVTKFREVPGAFLGPEAASCYSYSGYPRFLLDTRLYLKTHDNFRSCSSPPFRITLAVGTITLRERTNDLLQFVTGVDTTFEISCIYLCFLLMARQPLVGLDLLFGVPRSHTDTPHLVRLPWTSDQPDEETTARHHSTLSRDRYPCPRRNSNSQFQQASGHRPTP